MDQLSSLFSLPPPSLFLTLESRAKTCEMNSWVIKCYVYTHSLFLQYYHYYYYNLQQSPCAHHPLLSHLTDDSCLRWVFLFSAIKTCWAAFMMNIRLVGLFSQTQVRYHILDNMFRFQVDVSYAKQYVKCVDSFKLPRLILLYITVLLVVFNLTKLLLIDNNMYANSK